NLPKFATRPQSGLSASADQWKGSGETGRFPQRAAARVPAGTIAVKPVLFVHGWTPSSNNTTLVTGRLLLKGKPVSGVRVRVDGYVVPAPTDAQGRFSYPADVTLARRHVITVASAENAAVGG